MTVPDRTRWTRRLARYQRLAERTREASGTGVFHQANNRYNAERAALEARYGSWEAAGRTREGEIQRQTIFERVNQAEETFYTSCTAPLTRAATLLALTPAPDLPGLLAKIRVMQVHELQEEGALPKATLELLAEDVGGSYQLTRCKRRRARQSPNLPAPPVRETPAGAGRNLHLSVALPNPEDAQP